MTQPDMRKVREALLKYPRRTGKTTVEYPLKPSPPAQDAAIRKPLTAHGVKCSSGFFCSHFLNTHDC